ncbi:hypothetical protein QUB63_31145 [Microcoleus sp. ARI1-B5]|uniref:hypothetical protein n=1 Tax=unclassified Microcoleus TaxID=2642155 RepID=UPI002FD3408C
MSVCSLDKLASIDMDAGRNSGIFGLLSEAVTELHQFDESKFEFWERSSQRIQSIAHFNVATSD